MRLYRFENSFSTSDNIFKYTLIKTLTSGTTHNFYNICSYIYSSLFFSGKSKQVMNTIRMARIVRDSDSVSKLYLLYCYCYNSSLLLNNHKELKNIIYGIQIDPSEIKFSDIDALPYTWSWVGNLHISCIIYNAIRNVKVENSQEASFRLNICDDLIKSIKWNVSINGNMDLVKTLIGDV